MPTVLRKGELRFFFFSREPNEPPHIHVEAGDKYAKYWLGPVSAAQNFGFKEYELNRISKIVDENKVLFRRKWNEYFS